MKDRIVLISGLIRCQDGKYRQSPLSGNNSECIEYFTERGANMVAKGLEKMGANVEVKNLRDYWLEKEGLKK